MSSWHAHYRNEFGEYEITFTSKEKEKTFAVEKVCKAIMDGLVQSPDDTAIVVRCKDCKNWQSDIGWCDEHSSFIDEKGIKCHAWESDNWRMFNEDDYCSYGERKERDKNEL